MDQSAKSAALCRVGRCILGFAFLSTLGRTAQFEDVTAALGLKIGGQTACWADLDNDGWTDLCAGGAVWRNDQGKSFTKIADVGSVVAADFDNDGWVDLFSFSQMKLYRNKSGKGFEEVKLPALPPTGSPTACWGDFDGDRFVDLYIAGYEGAEYVTLPSFILMNRRGKSFQLARTMNVHKTRGATVCDFNRDHALDVYLSNYRLQANVLWLNDGKGGFTDEAAKYNVVATSPGFPGGHSIGAAWGDFDGDGEFDLFAGNFAHVDHRGDQPKSRFLRNLGPKASYVFEDKGTCGVFYQESYASPAAGDFDNDGLLDLYFTTVYATASFGKLNFPVLYRNTGAFKFVDAAEAAGLAKLGATYQAAWADFDNDGRLDLVTDGKLFRNKGTDGNWLKVRLFGDGKRVDRSAIGAQVRVRTRGKTFTRQVEAGTGQGNQNDLVLHFGLGKTGKTVDVEITWPNGEIRRLRGIQVNRRLDVGPKSPKGAYS